MKEVFGKAGGDITIDLSKVEGYLPQNPGNTF